MTRKGPRKFVSPGSFFIWFYDENPVWRQVWSLFRRVFIVFWMFFGDPVWNEMSGQNGWTNDRFGKDDHRIWACPSEKCSLSNKKRLRESPEELFPRGSFFILFSPGASILPLFFDFEHFLECFARMVEDWPRRPFCRDRRRFSAGGSQNLSLS